MAAGHYDVELFRRILAATHQEGQYATQYSNIYDLRRRLIYHYRRHDFEHVLSFVLREELRKGSHKYRLGELFK